MISGEQIQQAVERLVAAANPIKVILFVPYARGDADFDHYDELTNDVRPLRARRCDRRFRLDLMVIERELASETMRDVREAMLEYS